VRLIEKFEFIRLGTKQELLNSVPEGKARTFHLKNKRICLVRKGDEFFALNDKCPHQGASLGGGLCVEDSLIECPWHKYRFDLKTGRERTGTGEAVRIYKVVEREDGVYIGFPYLGFSWR